MSDQDAIRGPFVPEAPLAHHSDASDAGFGAVYTWHPEAALAVNVALATGRPLLVLGPPGCGKTTLAANLARRMGWTYRQEAITSRTQARDLQWRFDEVARLSDAQDPTRSTRPLARYLEPGPLWWAFDPTSAADRGLDPEDAARLHDDPDDPFTRAADTAIPFAPPTPAPTAAFPLPTSVLLLDELDKADPDVPNDLLTLLSLWSFPVRGRAAPVACPEDRRPLLVLTSNGERDLPGAFVRRCVVVRLPYPSTEELVTIARAHHGPTLDEALARALAERTVALADLARIRDLRPPGTSEYLDALRALTQLGLGLDHPHVGALLRAVLSKEDAAP